MPEIKVSITQNSSEVSNKSFKVESDKLSDLLKSLAQAKEDTNTALTKMIESSKATTTTTTQNNNQDDEDLDDEEDSDEDENDVENLNKKIKT